MSRQRARPEGGGVPARTLSHRLGHRTQKSAFVSAPTSTDRKRLRKEAFVRKVSVSYMDYGGHAPGLLVSCTLFLFLSPEGRQVGGRAEAHLGPSSRALLAHARVRRRVGRGKGTLRHQEPLGLTASLPPPRPSP